MWQRSVHCTYKSWPTKKLNSTTKVWRVTLLLLLWQMNLGKVVSVGIRFLPVFFCEQRLKEKEKQQPGMLWLGIQIPQQGGEVFFQVALPLLADIQMKERVRVRLPLRPPAELTGISSSTWSRSTRRSGKMHRMTRNNSRPSGEIRTPAHSPSLHFTSLVFQNVDWNLPKLKNEWSFSRMCDCTENPMTTTVSSDKQTFRN